MRLTSLAFATAATLSLTACATAPDTLVGPATYTRAAGEPAPPHARYYAECIAASAAAGTFVKEPGQNHLRFTCDGSHAREFYDALGPWSAAAGSEVVTDGRIHRFTQKLMADPVGIDDCSTDSAGDYSCTVVLNVGEFLTAD